MFEKDAAASLARVRKDAAASLVHDRSNPLVESRQSKGCPEDRINDNRQWFLDQNRMQINPRSEKDAAASMTTQHPIDRSFEQDEAARKEWSCVRMIGQRG